MRWKHILPGLLVVAAGAGLAILLSFRPVSETPEPTAGVAVPPADLAVDRPAAPRPETAAPSEQQPPTEIEDLVETCGPDFYAQIRLGVCDPGEALTATLNAWRVIPYEPVQPEFCEDVVTEDGSSGTTCNYDPDRQEGRFAALDNEQLVEMGFESADAAPLIVAADRLSDDNQEQALGLYLQASALAGAKAGDPLLIAGSMFATHTIGPDSQVQANVEAIVTRLALEQLAAAAEHPAAIPAQWESALQQATSSPAELEHYRQETARVKAEFESFIDQVKGQVGIPSGGSSNV